METFQKPLTQEEEAEYIRLLRDGSPEEAQRAQKILVERNLRLVVHIAKKYQNVDEDIEDFISIGCIGLIKAIRTFDEKKGRLATYACRCIENELLMFLRGKKKSSREVSLFEPIRLLYILQNMKLSAGVLNIRCHVALLTCPLEHF